MKTAWLVVTGKGDRVMLGSLPPTNRETDGIKFLREGEERRGFGKSDRERC